MKTIYYPIVLAAALLLTAPDKTAAQNLNPAYAADQTLMIEKLNKIHPKLTCSPYSISSIPADTNSQMTGKEKFRFDIAVLLARLKDGHTTIIPDSSAHWFPVRLYLFSDGLTITAIDQKYKQLLGYHVNSINGIPWQKALDRIDPILSADNSFWKMETGPIYITCLEVLQYFHMAAGNSLHLSVTDGRNNLDITLQAGKGDYSHSRWMQWGEMYCAFKDVAAVRPGYRPMDFRENKAALPLTQRNRIPYFYTYLEKPEILYFQYNFVENEWAGVPYLQFVDSMFQWIDANKNRISQFVIDFRYNSGGNGELINPFLHQIMKRDWLNQKGKIYGIMGRKTFSAGVMLYQALKEHTNAIFVGEPLGAGVNHYGDPMEFTLPDSQIGLQISTLFWQNGKAGDTTHFAAPDLPVLYQSAGYFAGTDPAMQLIMTKPLPIIDFALTNTADATLKLYKTVKEQYRSISWWRPFGENDMNSLAYTLLRSKNPEKALFLFELNSQEYPESWNAWDSLGEAYLKAGNKEGAIRCYRKSVELNPDNSNGKQALKELLEGH